MADAKKWGRIVYYDPNEEMLNTNSAILNGVRQDISNNISVDQEDLSMYVNLKVAIPRRERSKNNNRRQISFMEGSEIDCNEKTYNLLTTSYSDVHFNEIKNKDERNKELFGIKSIDISFDQQFYPQVTIQFTDIRGYSLFQPTEYSYKMDGNKKDNYDDKVMSSFFSSIFKFPYPIFTLEVKGFYGEAVSFELAVNEFKSSFNASTGNFDVTITFIGYMYGLYTDIPMSFVLTSPFFDLDGDANSTYWANKIKENIFTFPEYSVDGNGKKIPQNSTRTIPTYLDFLRKYKDLIALNSNDPIFNEKLKGISEIYGKNKQIADKLSNLKNAYNLYNESIKEAFQNTQRGYCLEGKDHFLIFSDKEDNLKNVQAKISNFKRNFQKAITECQNALNGNNVGLQLFVGEREIKEFGRGSFFFGKKDIDNIVLIVKGNNFIEQYGCFLKNGEYYLTNDAKKILNNHSGDFDHICVWKKAGWRRNKPINGYEDLCFSDYEDYSDTAQLDDLISQINNKLESKKDVAIERINEVTENILGFKPSIENMYRMFYAYLDCFMNYIFNNVKQIENENRTKEYLGLGDDKIYKTDIPSKIKSVPPFPLVAKSINGKQEIIYPGEISSNFLETTMVDNIFKNVKNFENEYKDAMANIAATESAVGSVSITDEIPFLYSDLWEGLPYNGLIDDNGDIDTEKFLWAIGLRLVSFEYLFKIKNGKTDSKVEGKVEAFNFYKQNPNLPKNDFYKIVNSINNGQLHEFLLKNGIIDKNNECAIIKGNAKSVLLKGWTKGDFEELYKADKNNVILEKAYTEKFNTNFNNNTIRFENYENNIDRLLKIKNNNWVNSGEEKDFYKDWEKLERYNWLSKEKIKVKDENICIKSTRKDGNQYNLDSISYDSYLNVLNLILENGKRNNEYKNETYQKAAFFFLMHQYYFGVGQIDEDGEYYTDIIGTGFNYRASSIFTDTIENALCMGAYFKYEGSNPFENIPQDGIRKIYKEIFAKNAEDYSLWWTASNVFSIERKNKYIRLFENWCKGTVYGAPSFPSILANLKDKNSWVKDGDKMKIEKGSLLYNSLINFISSKVIVYYTGLNEDEKELKDDRVNSFVNSFSKELEKLYNFDKEEDVKSATEEQEKNKEIKKSIYYTLKNIYDKWLCCAGINDQFSLKTPQEDINDRNSLKNTLNGRKSEYSRMVFVDSLYKDISNEMIMDISSLKDVIDMEINSEKSASFYEVMASLAEKNKSLLLSVPIFTNKMDRLFKPYSYGRSNTINSGPTYIFLYPGENSHILNDNYSEFTDDGISDLAGTNGVQDIGGVEVNDFPFRAFGVGYGMQNQNYFTNININMDTPSVTDYSIANTLHLANSSKDGDLTKATILGQSLYPIFANRSYVCSVDMLGCAGITPFMHFQLNNIPMFKGVYIITNVSHKIAPGKFTTTFTGTRVAKYNYPPNRIVFDMDELMNRINLKVEGERSFSNSESNESRETSPNVSFTDTNAWDIPNIDTIMEDNYKYNDILAIKRNGNNVVTFETGRDDQESRFNKCKYSIRKLLYDIANEVKDKKDYNIKVTSSLRHESDKPHTSCKSAHRYGFAVDLKADRDEKSSDLFALCAGHINEIDQLIWEDKSINNEKINTVENCIHISTAKETHSNAYCSAEKIENRKQIWQAYDSAGHIIENINALAPHFKHIYAQLAKSGKLNENDRYLKKRDAIIKWSEEDKVNNS